MSSMVERMLKELGIDLDAPKEKKQFNVPETPDGFETLVSKEEFEAIKKLADSFADYIDIHNKSVIRGADNVLTASPYARIQYSILSGLVDDVIELIDMMVHIHTLDKKFIDDQSKDYGGRVEVFEKVVLASMIAKKQG